MIGGNGLVLAPGSDGSTIRGLAFRGFRTVTIEGPPGPRVRRDRRPVRAATRSRRTTSARPMTASRRACLERPGDRRHRQREHDRWSRRRQPRLREHGLRDPDRRLHGRARQRHLGQPRRHECDRKRLDAERHRHRHDQRRTPHADRRRDLSRGQCRFGAGFGIDIQGIAGVPDNSEIRFNNVGVGQDGTTTLGRRARGRWASTTPTA